MIVTCEQCSTQFQLDDARVPDDGVRVRCSRCKHAFVVKKAAAAGDPVDRVVEQAVDDGAEAAAAAAQDEQKPFDDSLEESDWEFNHDPSEEGGEPADGAAVAGLDEEEPPDSEPEPEPAEAAEAGDQGGSSMEGLLDSHAIDEEDLDEPSGLEIGGTLGGDVEEEIDTALGAPVGMPASALATAEPAETPPPASAPEPPAATASRPSPEPPSEDPFGSGPAPEAPAASAELGSPENWDFFDDAESQAAAPAPVAIGRIGLTTAARAQARPPVEVDAEPSKVMLWLGRGLGLAGWLTVCALLGATFHGLASPAADVSGAAAPSKVGGLAVSDVRGSWLDNAIAGPIYVISGRLSNTGSRHHATRSRLAIQLFDAQGAVVADDAAAVAHPLPERRLRTADPAELRAELLLQSRALAWAYLEPGGSWAFQALLGDVPEEARRFDLVELPPEAAPPTEAGRPVEVAPPAGAGQGEAPQLSDPGAS